MKECVDINVRPDDFDVLTPSLLHISNVMAPCAILIFPTPSDCRWYDSAYNP